MNNLLNNQFTIRRIIIHALVALALTIPVGYTVFYLGKLSDSWLFMLKARPGPIFFIVTLDLFAILAVIDFLTMLISRKWLPYRYIYLALTAVVVAGILLLRLS